MQLKIEIDSGVGPTCIQLTLHSKLWQDKICNNVLISFDKKNPRQFNLISHGGKRDVSRTRGNFVAFGNLQLFIYWFVSC